MADKATFPDTLDGFIYEFILRQGDQAKAIMHGKVNHAGLTALMTDFSDLKGSEWVEFARSLDETGRGETVKHDVSGVLYSIQVVEVGS